MRKISILKGLLRIHLGTSGRRRSESIRIRRSSSVFNCLIRLVALLQFQRDLVGFVRFDFGDLIVEQRNWFEAALASFCSWVTSFRSCGTLRSGVVPLRRSARRSPTRAEWPVRAGERISWAVGLQRTLRKLVHETFLR